MSMKLKEFLKTAADIEECDRLLNSWERGLYPMTDDKPLSREIREVMRCAVIQRRSNLIVKLKNYGVEVEV